MIRSAVQMKVEQRPQMRGGAGTVSLQHYFQPEEFGAKCRLCAKLTLPPGAGIGAHAHEQEDEVYIILSGRGVIEDDGVARPVQAGDAVLTGRGGTHAVRNDGTETLEILAVIMKYESTPAPAPKVFA